MPDHRLRRQVRGKSRPEPRGTRRHGYEYATLTLNCCMAFIRAASDLYTSPGQNLLQYCGVWNMLYVFYKQRIPGTRSTHQ
jgi:hypothetical protein